MKRQLLSLAFMMSVVTASANGVFTSDSLAYSLEEISVVAFYRANIKCGKVIDRESLIRLNKGQEPSFILATRPSIFAYSDTGNEYGYSYFRMRGMDQTRVNMTLDGMPLNEGEDMGVYLSNYPDILASMHSVQVDNGATISSNGVAGYAGSIDFESVDLKRDTISSVYAGYGSFNTFKSSVEYNTGMKGKFAGHFKATQQQSDGFRDHAYNNSQSAFVKLGYFMNDRHTVDLLSFVGQSRNGQGWIGSTLDEITANPSSNGCSSAETDKFIQNINKLQYSAYLSDNISLTASLYYNYLKGHYYFDLDNYMRKLVEPEWATTGEIDCYNLQHNMFGGNVAGKFHWRNFSLTTGLNASTFNRRHIGTNNISTDEMWRNRGYKNDVNVFVKGEYNYKELSIGTNVQYRHADFDYKGDVAFDKINWDFLNWSVNLGYRFGYIYSVYATVTQTHREPTRSDMFGGEENFSDLVTTQAESVIDYELGYNITAEKLSGNLNLYYMDFENELILNGAMGTNGLPIRENAAHSYRAGVEVNLTYAPVAGLRFTNSTAWSMNRVKTDTETLSHVLSPSWLLMQGVSYSTHGFEIGADVRYRSKMYFDLVNQYELPESLRFNLHATYIFGKITIGAYVNNIFNNRSYSNGMMGVNGPLYFIDAPRNFFIDARWTF